MLDGDARMKKKHETEVAALHPANALVLLTACFGKWQISNDERSNAVYSTYSSTVYFIHQHEVMVKLKRRYVSHSNRQKKFPQNRDQIPSGDTVRPN